ncbi:MAG: biosynthetic-type acetolactate synthase large subunit [Flavobacteriales bacterium]|nr:biosynthetic-type acetolactate synthase large subunit [Flavobacteriales bacterium]
MNSTTYFPTDKMTEPRTITGSQAIIESILAEDTDVMFGYPGGQVIPIYDALYDYQDRINHVLVRHEQAAVHAAQGYARASGRVGVCMVTSGPGATNTVTGLADAMMDSTPIVLISGQVGANLLGTDSFQETNFIGITQAVTKWNVQVKRAEDIPDAIARAFYIARSGRPGPVVVDITKDAQVAKMSFHYRKIENIRSYVPAPALDMEKIADAAKLINLAKRPMALIGQGVVLAGAEKELLSFLEKSGMPAASTLLGLSAIPSSHPLNVGMLGMHGNYGPNIKNKECDLLVAIGMRFDDRVTGTADTFGINAKIVHLEIDPSEINKLVYADVPVVGDVKESLPVLTELITKNQHAKWVDEFRACYDVEYAKIIEDEITPSSGKIRMGEVVRKISDATADKSIMVTDVGQHQMMAARYFKYYNPRTIITSGGLGTMGFGLPAAIGAKLSMPEKTVCLFVGDGGIQMNIQELCTIMQSHVGVKIILLNNSYLGMVRQWQELFFRQRYSFTELLSPDFSLIAKANKINYRCVEKREDLDSAINEMLANDDAFLLEVKVDSMENVFPMVPAGASVSDIILE